MLLSKFKSSISASQITPKSLYLRRRALLKAGLLGSAALLTGHASRYAIAEDEGKLSATYNAAFSTDEPQTSFDSASSYNNFYEFGTDKRDPARHAHRLKTKPWAVRVDGEAELTGSFDIEDILKQNPLQERVYRLRCVEAWSMVIPWIGFPLADWLASYKPTSRAKYVAFETLADPEQMPGIRRAVLDWPYREGLRIDEAMHPLSFIAVGMYGEVMPKQNGAPLRLVVPWKYGFKSIKSIVRINFTEQQPHTSWSDSAPAEYGFYSNVNPERSHPRWSQKTERRLVGDDSSLFGALFVPRQDTQKFNGYADQVASLYTGMDLIQTHY